MLISDLYNKHHTILTTAEDAALKEHVRRQIARQNFVLRDDLTEDERGIAFLKIERVYEPEPVYLYGSDVPSLAHSVVSVFRGKKNPAGDGYMPDECILTARISERHLTSLILNANNASNGLCLTTQSIGGQTLPPYRRRANRLQEATREYQMEKKQRIAEQFSALEAMLTDGSFNRTQLRDAFRSLTYSTEHVSSNQFEAEQFMQGMSKARMELAVEASHAALHEARVLAAIDAGQARLENHAEDAFDLQAACADNPMIDVLAGDYSDTLREAIVKVITAEVLGYADRHPEINSRRTRFGNTEMVEIGTGQQAVLAYSAGAALRAHFDSLHYLQNDAVNEHIAARRGASSPYQLSAELVRVQGRGNNIHASIPLASDAFFRLEILGSVTDDTFGVAGHQSTGASLLSIEITDDELMMALRGHPDGRPVPCSFRTILGRTPGGRLPPQSALERGIEEISDSLSNSAEVQRMKAAHEALHTLIEAKRTGAKYQEDLRTSLDEYRAAVDMLLAASDQATHEVFSRISQFVAAKSREDLLSCNSQITGLFTKALSSE